MADNTAIEWADRTWNPLLGCERVSPGCDACYATRTATIRAGNPHPKVAAAFAGLTERRDGRLDWTGRINLLDDRLSEPLTVRKPQKFFVNSQSDLFHKDVPDAFIAKMFAVMAATPQHTFQVLTKRHARMRSLLSRGTLGTEGFPDMVENAMAEFTHAGLDAWPLPNLWLGVSVEDQHWADIRIPALLDTPAAVRWLSCEPLLGHLDLTTWTDQHAPWNYTEFGTECTCGGAIVDAQDRCNGDRLNWVVVGGESGHGARPMHPDWARALRDQCIEGGVPFFFTQWGEWVPAVDLDPDLRERAQEQLAGEEYVCRVGKKRAGRLLDGQTWDEFPRQPEAVAA